MSAALEQYWPAMFLVRVEPGRKPRLYRVDSREVVGVCGGRISLRRRAPRAWWLKPRVRGGAVGVAAVADSIEQAHALVERLVAQGRAEG
jgi:hypothetical protein